jgi:hypothetical protein
MSAEDPTVHIWPDDLPPDCPPTDAIAAEGAFYRFVKNDPPTIADFSRPRDLPRKKPIPPEELCEHSALSLYATPEDVRLARQYIPGFNKKKIALGQLARHMGVVYNSPTTLSPEVTLKSHTDWWIPTTHSPGPEFKVVSL